MRYVLPFCFSLFALPGFVNANVNGYAAITAISGTQLTVGTTNESAATFTVGKMIILMQMQDDVIGANTGDNASFGNLSLIKNAGNFVVRTITGVTRSSGVLTGITLNLAPGANFTVGTNSAVQAITYELLGAGGNYTTVAAIAAPAWNGSVGGVVAIQVAGILTLQHNITADGLGFRGGALDPTGYDVCYPNVYRASSTDANTWRYASKGEGIYKLTNTAWADARGKIINGGGGGNGINAGGAGGGNFTAGGDGGAGWNCSAMPSGGIGGIALASYISASRVFMGGAGGGGEGNDNVSTAGGNGGGIILIKAKSIITTGSCGGLKISANGATALNAGNDGAGGGGAGGSVVLDVESFSIAAGCKLTISANGGSGGSINTADTHGAGGGGGQGTMIYSAELPTTNIISQTANGLAGCNNSSLPCNNAAGMPAGIDGVGVRSGFTTTLPIELLHFDAVAMNDHVDLDWSTASESNNAWFLVERSVDLQEWETVVQLAGAGNSSSILRYSSVDPVPVPGISYYRLRQVDLNGNSSISDVVPVQFTAGAVSLSLFPNPAADRVAAWAVGVSSGRVELFNSMGRSVGAARALEDQHADIDLSALSPGVYVVVLTTPDRVFEQRLLVRH